ncbi:hypothetical protein AB0F91_06630 [Amycolatopsis sp. NPDC023774]|uniref:hypothetical protein n=1 Tax=Amycolatopsis sp. NPDC023774 TaxID=3155015 RepID=UPI0033D79601
MRRFLTAGVLAGSFAFGALAVPATSSAAVAPGWCLGPAPCTVTPDGWCPTPSDDICRRS